MENKNNAANVKKGFWARLMQSLDKKMQEQAKKQPCCCAGKKEEKDDSCCNP
ncbi:MAG: hypothetical protein MUF05_03245 [Candidatus Omnitrophica bacterium]|nr:hypothetical protein [Candidatus Omnitrophota bacterium]